MIHSKPGKFIYNNKTQQQINQLKINICDNKYQLLRDELLLLAQQSSTWIRTVFINSPTVFVSSKDYFDKLLRQWMIDPCTINNTSSTVSGS